MNKEIVSIIPLALLAVFLVTNLDLITSGNSKDEFTITIHKCATGEKSKLKACPADVTSVWDNCFGTYDGKNGKKNSIVELARSVYQDEVALYQGEWKNDLFHGCGIETIPSRGTYTGQFKNGLVEGFGIQEFPNGQVYKGDWKNNMKHGVGEDTYATGDRYLGEFKNNMRHGCGKEYWESEPFTGAVFTGSYENDFRHGPGEYIRANGTGFECVFTKGTCPGREFSGVELDNKVRSD